ncbi:MAG: 2,3-diaminopropionate biosynthesis protein SbnB [Nannocystaceae bacterium]
MSHSPTDRGIRILGAADVQSTLEGAEADILSAVQQAYISHYEARTSLPHSSFLRFPQNDRNRIIALPGYLGEPFNVAGLKWIASFPGNTSHGLARASALMVLNDLSTGFPTAVLEGATISAKRTAASAALAARVLHPDPHPTKVALVGAGRSNAEVLAFLRFVFPSLTNVYVHDADRECAFRFVRDHADSAGIECYVLERAEDALREAALVSFATTAPAPYLADDGAWAAGATVLNISLRDLHPGTILRSVNVTDDIEHACRERTSLHLAEIQEGHRRFVDGTLERVLLRAEPYRSLDDARPLIFTPFGLGVLDLALAALVLQRAEASAVGSRVPGFSVPVTS